MVILEQIGSYAGLAAIVGLAVLSALYFSQARDLRRLREEGVQREAPAPGAGATVRPVARPAASQQHPGQPSAAPARTQAARPAAAAPAAAGAAAASAAAGRPATAAGATAQAPAGAAPAGAAPATPATAAANPAPPASAQPAPTGAHSAQPATAAKPATGAQPAPTGARPAVAPAKQAPTAAPARPPAAARPRGASTTTRPPTLRAASGSPGREPWYRRIEPRYLALAIAGVLVLGAGAAYGVAALTGEDPAPAPPPVEEVSAGGDGKREREPRTPVDPSSVTVSVLNGTNVPGLATEIGDTIETAGFQRGNVTNASNQESAESVVLYADGASDAARVVGRELDISQIQPIDPDNQSLAGDAAVVVVVGADQVE